MGYQKRDIPCERCGWEWPGDHVCIDLSVPIDPRIQRKHSVAYASFRTPEHRRQLSEGLTERWQRHREATAGRDAEIVRRYNQGGIGIKKLGEQFSIAYQTCSGILRRAEMRGETKIRPRGNNIRWEDQEGSDGVRA